MSTLAEVHEPQSSESTYFTDSESVAEMARLTRQAQMLGKQIGLLPPLIR
jgi:hypothetical protein